MPDALVNSDRPTAEATVGVLCGGTMAERPRCVVCSTAPARLVVTGDGKELHACASCVFVYLHTIAGLSGAFDEQEQTP